MILSIVCTDTMPLLPIVIMFVMHATSNIINNIDIDADVVCLQEVAPASFEQDFEFMEQLGYDGVELFRKGRFRPATFWKTSKCQLVNAVHKDRTLLTAFSVKEKENHWHVLNCHLQAGKMGQRRVRQINEGVRAAMTLSRKLKGRQRSIIKRGDEIRYIVHSCSHYTNYRERSRIVPASHCLRRFQWRSRMRCCTLSRGRLCRFRLYRGRGSRHF